jgi:predicted DNA-binding protein (MmcQ/YjbR family)
MAASRGKDPLATAEAALRRDALAHPEAYEDFPWGERAVKIRGKVFVFLNRGENGLSLSVKLPRTGLAALLLPFAEPTGYGLARGGWVTARFRKGDKVPVPLLYEWIEESYRAVAPKRPPDPAQPKRGPSRRAGASPRRSSGGRTAADPG